MTTQPDEILDAMRKAIKRWESAAPGTPEERAAAEEVSNRARRIDGWLSEGGYLPRAWRSPWPDSARPAGSVTAYVTQNADGSSDLGVITSGGGGGSGSDSGSTGLPVQNSSMWERGELDPPDYERPQTMRQFDIPVTGAERDDEPEGHSSDTFRMTRRMPPGRIEYIAEQLKKIHGKDRRDNLMLMGAVMALTGLAQEMSRGHWIFEETVTRGRTSEDGPVDSDPHSILNQIGPLASSNAKYPPDITEYWQSEPVGTSSSKGEVSWALGYATGAYGIRQDLKKDETTFTIPVPDLRGIKAIQVQIGPDEARVIPMPLTAEELVRSPILDVEIPQKAKERLGLLEDVSVNFSGTFDTGVAEQIMPELEVARPGDEVKRLYLCGRIRGGTGYKAAFARAAAALRAAGYEVFNPVEHIDGVADSDEVHSEELGAERRREALAQDLAWIARYAHGIANLRSARSSPGAQAEMALARAIGVPIHNVDDWVDLAPAGEQAAAGKIHIPAGPFTPSDIDALGLTIQGVAAHCRECDDPAECPGVPVIPPEPLGDVSTQLGQAALLSHTIASALQEKGLEWFAGNGVFSVGIPGADTSWIIDIHPYQKTENT